MGVGSGDVTTWRPDAASSGVEAVRFFNCEWKPGERYRVYGGTARLDCVIYARDSDEDLVGRPTGIVGRYDDLDGLARSMNLSLHPKGWVHPVDEEWKP